MKKKFKKLSLNTETLGRLGDSNLVGVVGATQQSDLSTCTVACSMCTAVCSGCTANCTLCGIACSAPCG